MVAGGVSGGQGSACGTCTPTTTTQSSTTTSSTTTTAAPTTTTTTLAPGVNYGYDVEFPSPSAHSPDYLLGIPVMVPAPSMLTHLCVITKGVGPNVVLSLYSDNAGWPDQLVAATSPTPMTLGRMEIPVALTPLAAGTYWLMGVYDTDASIGMDDTDPTAAVRYAPQPFASPLPNPFGSATPYSGQKFNYFVKVQ